MVKTKFNNNCRGEVSSPIKVSPIKGTSETDKNKGGVFQPIQKDLPAGWVKSSMNNVCTIIQGQSPPSSTYNVNGEGLPFFQGKAEFGERYPIVVKWCSKPKKIAQKNDILISVRAPVGPTNIAHSKCCIGRGLAAIRPLDGTEYLYIFYYLRSIESELSAMGTGTTFKAISGSDLRSISIPLAPLDQQKLIVAEIEKQFSRLDEAVAALKRIQANLKRYKASVLKAAVEGKLSEQWRKEHPDVEPATDLLKRILTERRKKWEEDYVKKCAVAHSHAPKDDSWRKKYKEPTSPDISKLPQLPEGWVWATVEQLAKNEPNAIKAGPFGSSLKKSFYVRKGFKIYGQEQVLRDDPYFGDYYIDKRLYETLKSCAVQPGDILISLVGTIGRVLILPKDIEPGIINPRLVKLSMDNRTVNAKFIKAYIQSPHVKHLFSLSSHGGTMDILNLTILKEIPISLPPLDEQNIIIEELERIFSVVQELELIIDANEKRAERLRQSILKKAFSGKLVSIESNEDGREYLAEIVT
jgi:type I restriction enzyme S subunit